MDKNLWQFGRAWGAAGVQGFYGEGHWHYNLPFRKPDFTGIIPVFKTVTLNPRAGNVKKGLWDKIFPSWARVKFSTAHTLNAMGLPNPGIKALLESKRWQALEKPFFISVMAVESTLEKRLEELRKIVDIIQESLVALGFKTWVGLQVNRSCPNTGHDINTSEIIEESLKGTEIIYRGLGWPVVEKFAIDTAPIEALKELQSIPHCHGICISNTVKYNYRGLGKEIFGKNISPLAHLGGGGISGPKLLPLVCDYIKRLRDAGFKKYINGCGGIFCEYDIEQYRNADSDSISIGTVATHHPGRVKELIKFAQALTWRQVK